MTTYLSIDKGSRIGLHAIYPRDAIPLAKQANDAGAPFAVIKGVDNGGIAIDARRVSPASLTITRFVNTAEDNAQGVHNWTPAQMTQRAAATVGFTFNRLSVAERAAAHWLEVINEAGPEDPNQSGGVPGQRKPFPVGWAAFGYYCRALIAEADRLGVKLALPAFNSGQPEWSEMVAFVKSGVFCAMKQGGHILTLHEGTLDDAASILAFDSIPGAPAIERAGPIFFRYRYLYHLLAQRDEVVPLVISEWYGGYKLPAPLLAGRMLLYDREAARDSYVLGILPFTVDPPPGNAAWSAQNYGPVYPTLIPALVSERSRVNGAGAPVPVPTPQPQPNAMPLPTICVTGVHGRADGRLQAADNTAIDASKVEAVKLLNTADPASVDVLRAQHPNMLIMVRLFESFEGRTLTPAQFVAGVLGSAREFYNRGVRLFEIHNEPNLIAEGFMSSWVDGATFAQWFNSVYALMKQSLPLAYFGFPGLSPGGAVLNTRGDQQKFLDGASAGLARADWVGVHCYFTSDADMVHADGGRNYERYMAMLPNKPLYITEFSNPTGGVSPADKAAQYVRYFTDVRKLRNFGAAFCFVVSASNPNFRPEVWREEDGKLTPIPSIIGAAMSTITGDATPPPANLVGKYVQLTGNLVLRNAPNVDAVRMTALYKGSAFTVQQQALGNWLRITDDGWVDGSKYVRVIVGPTI